MYLLQQQAPAPATRSFSLPQNLRKGQPGYAQTQNITFASDLERAAYSATTTTQSDTGKRKRQQYRNLLKESGYSDAEINTMGREVRDQMKGQYKGKGSPISVSLGQDVVAEAAPSEVIPSSLFRGVRGDVDPLEVRVDEQGNPYGAFFSTRKEVADSYIDDPEIESSEFTASNVKESDIIDVPVKDGTFNKAKFDQAVKDNPTKIIRAKDAYDIGPFASTERDPKMLYSYKSNLWKQK